MRIANWVISSLLIGLRILVGDVSFKHRRTMVMCIGQRKKRYIEIRTNLFIATAPQISRSRRAYSGLCALDRGDRDNLESIAGHSLC